MTIKKITSNKDVLDSGTVIIFDKESTMTFKLELSSTFNFSIELKFEEDSSLGQLLKQEVKAADNVIILTCINFNNSLGTGTTTPIELATFQGKKVYLNFWIYALGDGKLKKIDYTFYMER